MIVIFHCNCSSVINNLEICRWGFTSPEIFEFPRGIDILTLKLKDLSELDIKLIICTSDSDYVWCVGGWGFFSLKCLLIEFTLSIHSLIFIYQKSLKPAFEIDFVIKNNVLNLD